MSISAIAYTSTSDPKYVSKQLQQLASITMQPITPVDILSPSFRVEFYVSRYPINYVYVPEWHRYYYAKLELLDGQSCLLHCTVDPLMSYAAGIRSCSGVVTRSESIGKPTYIPDGKLPIAPGEVTVTAIRFEDSPFATGVQSMVPLYPYAVLSILNAGGAVI